MKKEIQIYLYSYVLRMEKKLLKEVWLRLKERINIFTIIYYMY
jgi:hypothetical protein